MDTVLFIKTIEYIYCYNELSPALEWNNGSLDKWWDKCDTKNKTQNYYEGSERKKKKHGALYVQSLEN